jgi:prepilin-type N-terminal cleavage/methylation domain-containing protein
MIKNNKGFTLIELIMVTIILGILAAVAIPRYTKTLYNAELRTEKTFVSMVWAGCESEAQHRLIESGTESWPFNPLSVLGRSRNVKINLTLGIPNEDDEWQLALPQNYTLLNDKPALMHQRRNDEVWYYSYDSTSFTLAEEPVEYTTSQ